VCTNVRVHKHKESRNAEECGDFFTQLGACALYVFPRLPKDALGRPRYLQDFLSPLVSTPLVHPFITSGFDLALKSSKKYLKRKRNVKNKN
jgi:hypothetical protein